LSAGMMGRDSDSMQRRSRSSAEVAFALMRALAIARILWPRGAPLSVERLADVADASVKEIASAVSLLCDEGVAVVDSSSGVRLSERAARELLGGGTPQSAANADGLDTAAVGSDRLMN